MKQTIYLLVMLSALFFAACNGGVKQSNETAGNPTPDQTVENSENKKVTVDAIIDCYLQLKNALAEDNSQNAAKAGKTMLAAFSNFDMSALTPDQHKEYMEIADDAKENAEHISESKIDHQREHFSLLSTDINDLITLIGTDKKLYRDFCPMYNDKKGAIWISETKEIKNPFYGNKMLNCGNIQKEIN